MNMYLLTTAYFSSWVSLADFGIWWTSRPAHLWQKYNQHSDLTPVFWSTVTAIYHRSRDRDRLDRAGDLESGAEPKGRDKSGRSEKKPNFDPLHSSVLLWAAPTSPILLWSLPVELWVNRTRMANLPVPPLSSGSQIDGYSACWAPNVTCTATILTAAVNTPRETLRLQQRGGNRKRT